MILFFYGPDTFRSRRHLAESVENFKKKRDPAGYNVVRISGTSGAGDGLLREITASPFLAEKRMVVIENLFSLKNAGLFETLLEMIENKKIPESTVLVVWEDKEKVTGKAAIALFEKLKQEPYSQEFGPLSLGQLSTYITTEVGARGGRIDRGATEYLAQMTGGDLWFVSTLIDQLVAYKNGESITKNDVEIFLEQKVDDNIFSLVDAIVARRGREVYRMIDEQYKKGEDAQFIFAMLLRQFRILYELRDLFDRDALGQSEMVAKQLGLHPFVVKKSLPIVRQYSSSFLRSLYQELLDIDRNTKTGRMDQSVLLDLFVGRLLARDTKVLS